MEKIMYPVWKPADMPVADFCKALTGPFKGKVLEDSSVRALKVCVADEQVEAAAPYRMVNLFESAFDGVVMLWVDSSTRREGLEELLGEFCGAYHGYLVTEAEQIPPVESVARPGERTTGMNEIVFLRRPPRLEYHEWLSIWQDSHTPIAIDTQSTFGYRQNVVVRPLTADAPPIDAIIEENFPEKAISSRLGFYDADDDPELYQQREQLMVESCSRFIDFDKLDCIPTSEYIFKRLG